MLLEKVTFSTATAAKTKLQAQLTTAPGRSKTTVGLDRGGNIGALKGGVPPASPKSNLEHLRALGAGIRKVRSMDDVREDARCVRVLSERVCVVCVCVCVCVCVGLDG